MRLLLLSICAIFILSSCQEDIDIVYGCMNPKADNYNPEANVHNGNCEGLIGCTDATATNFNSDAAVNCYCEYENVRRVLVEDYTGHKCGNCPRAAEKLKELHCEYGNQIIPLAVHVGFFARPTSAPFDNDYRTATGDQLDTDYGNSQAGLPNGLVNRKSVNNSFVQAFTAWEELIDQELSQTADATVEIETAYTSGSRTLNVDVTSTILKDLPSSSYNIAIYLVEDSINTPQTDYSIDGQVIEDYYHMHMLRGSVNGTYGEEVHSGGELSAGETVSLSSSVTIDNAIKPEHLYIVSFLCDATTNEIIQANQSPYVQ